ncbi:unnamed protein product [Phytomonas sp. EM1]|nr:unnamed protein product [Phytomonas sp. EM1]|eukprot:CCW63610.1 unnamed protein product [Phytomonas sp. isolate EM1]
MPGVYMISRTSQNIRNYLKPSSSHDRVIDFEQLHKDVEKLQLDIEQLVNSNKEILTYINTIGGDKDVLSCIEGEPSYTCPEDDVDIFIDALKENDLVIRKKQRELDHLRKIMNGLRCGCAHHALFEDQRAQHTESVTPIDHIIL